jgi:hypothetical protein
MGEDLASPPAAALMRSLSAPAEFGQPSHYSSRAYIGATRHFDGGGVHVNSGIANHAFYLAIEGGLHADTGVPVTGVGTQNREQIEKVFYRAFTSMLPSSATFYMARLATLQSARDQFGVNSAVERAIRSAWDAVGVYSPAAALTTQFSPEVVPPDSGTCGGTRPTFMFRVSVAEFQQVGFTVDAVEINTFDAAGRLIGLQRFIGTQFRDWFNQCQPGSTRIAPGAVACVTLCASLGGRTAGAALFTFEGSDDNANYGFFNSDYVMFGRQLFGTEPSDAATGTVTYTKAVQQ